MKLGFGGGCHWCTEAIFQSLKGVHLVEQGWIASAYPYQALSEAVVVHFGDEIGIELLIQVHLLTHSSTSNHRMRQKYRSAVYYFEQKEKDLIESTIEDLSKKHQQNYITQTLPFVDFKLNIESQRNYYLKGKQKPFCQTYIDPKLRIIREKFGSELRPGF